MADFQMGDYVRLLHVDETVRIQNIEMLLMARDSEINSIRYATKQEVEEYENKEIEEIFESLDGFDFEVNDVIIIKHEFDPDGLEASDKLDMRMYSDGTIGIAITDGMTGDTSSAVFSYKEFVPHLQALENLVEEVKKAKLNGE